MPKRKSIVKQVVDRLSAMAAWGHSKHMDKAANGGKPALEKVYSYSSMSNYIDAAARFARWARDTHGCKDIDQARTFTGEYLRSRQESGKSAWTVRRDAAALGKLYQCQTTDLGVELPVRHRGDVTQHRTNAYKGHFSETKHADLVSLCRSSGLRRHELAALRPSDVRCTADGRVLLTVRCGKGGKRRVIEALDSTAARLAEKAIEDGRDTVIARIPKYAPIHKYRAEFAQSLYAKIARDPRQISRSERYYCRGDRAGVVYDRVAMAVVSGALGHARVDVVTAYLR